MDRPFRWVVNAQTGERQQIALTDEEIERGAVKKAAEEAAAAIRAAAKAREDGRQALLLVLLDKIEADPTIIDRIR